MLAIGAWRFLAPKSEGVPRLLATIEQEEKETQARETEQLPLNRWKKRSCRRGSGVLCGNWYLLGKLLFRYEETGVNERRWPM